MATRVVLITGASSGIGRAAANLLHEHGLRVFGTSRQPEQVQEVDFALLPLDVRSDESAGRCVRAVVARAGRLDVLVNNAGYALSGAIEEASIDDVRRLFETNFYGVQRMIQAALPILRQQRSGQIINISSLAGLVGTPYLGIYSATKFALEGYSEALRCEIRRFNIHVSLIEPGDIHTPIVTERPAYRIGDYDGVRERANAVHEANVRSGPGPELVARTVLRVINSRSPRLHYAAARGTERLIPLGKRLLPDRIIERLVRSFYRLDE